MSETRHEVFACYVHVEHVQQPSHVVSALNAGAASRQHSNPTPSVFLEVNILRSRLAIVRLVMTQRAFSALSYGDHKRVHCVIAMSCKTAAVCVSTRSRTRGVQAYVWAHISLSMLRCPRATEQGNAHLHRELSPVHVRGNGSREVCHKLCRVQRCRHDDQAEVVTTAGLHTDQVGDDMGLRENQDNLKQ